MRTAYPVTTTAEVALEIHLEVAHSRRDLRVLESDPNACIRCKHEARQRLIDALAAQQQLRADEAEAA